MCCNKFKNIFFIIFFIIQFGFYLKVNGQYPDKLNYFQEPGYTAGDSNILIIKTPSSLSPNHMINHYISISRQGPWLPFKAPGTISPATDYYFPPDDISQPLKHGVKYYYKFEIFNVKSLQNVKTSEIDSSIQDIIPPHLSDSSFSFVPVDGEWWNMNNFQINYSLMDTAGIDSIFLYYRVPMGKWIKDPTNLQHPFIVDSSIVNNDSISSNFTVIVTQDNEYDFYIGAKDAAHAAKSCANHWKFDGNENIPTDRDSAHLSIKIDTHRPISSIDTMKYKKYQNNFNFSIPFFAYESISDLVLIASGVEKVILYYQEDDKFVPKDTINYIKPFSVSLNDMFSNFKVLRDGGHSFYIQACDRAGNCQTTFDTVKIYADTTQPQIENLTLFDTTVTPSQIENAAQKGWTNSVFVWAITDTLKDNLSGIESILFYGDLNPDSIIIPFTDSALIELTPGDGLKTVFCKISDRAGNWSQPKASQIILDTDTPEFGSFELRDKLGHPDTTANLTVMMFNSFSDSEKSIFQIAFFEDSSIAPIKRESLWRVYASEDSFIFSKRLGPLDLALYAQLSDSAGNISSKVYDSIYYDPELFIETLFLQDKDDTLKDNTGKKYTNNLEIKAHISGISRKLIKAHFEFTSDTTQLESILKIYYGDERIRIFENIMNREVTLALNSLGHNQTNNSKKVYVRLVNDSLGVKTYFRMDEIILDTVSPVIHAFSVADLTESDDPPNGFKAEPDWTNSQIINAQIKAEDTLSSCYQVKFIVESDTSLKPYQPKITDNLLPPREKEYVVKVEVGDLAGNWSVPFPDVINLDTTPPILSLPCPDKSLPIQHDGIININIKPSDKNNHILKLFYKTNYDNDWQSIVIVDTTKQIPIKLVNNNIGNLEIDALIIDKAGNRSQIINCQSDLVNDSEYYNELFAVVPNPFNPDKDRRTKIVYVSKEELPFQIRIYDVFGNFVRLLDEDERTDYAGRVDFFWDGYNGEKIPVAEGVYIAVASFKNRKSKDTTIGLHRR